MCQFSTLWFWVEIFFKKYLFFVSFNYPSSLTSATYYCITLIRLCRDYEKNSGSCRVKTTFLPSPRSTSMPRSTGLIAYPRRAKLQPARVTAPRTMCLVSRISQSHQKYWCDKILTRSPKGVLNSFPYEKHA